MQACTVSVLLSVNTQQPAMSDTASCAVNFSHVRVLCCVACRAAQQKMVQGFRKAWSGW
jgi:hypothetical protein